TRVYVGDGPLVNGPPHHRLEGHPEPSCPLVLVRRKAAAATYAAVHEPYAGRPPAVRSVSPPQGAEAGVGVEVEADGFSDRLLVGFGSSPRTILIRSPAGEGFQFAGYGFVRTAGQAVVARGKFEGFRIRVGDRGDLSLTVNGKQEPAVVRDGFLVYGEAGGGAEAAPGPAPDPMESPETRASVHTCFLPEEVRLKA